MGKDYWNEKFVHIFTWSLLVTLFIGCKKEKNTQPVEDCLNGDFFSAYASRDFKMGFSTWPYAKTIESVNNTYQFISNQGDIYSEHIDANIPWNAWINSTPLPAEFTDDIAGRVSRKIPDEKLTVSVSLLNTDRNELASDFDGTIPDYTALNDTEIEDAYFKHVEYITNQLHPDYLIIAIEVNELLLKSPDKWNGYKLLMANVKTRIKQAFPSLPISESITLHNLYEPVVSDPEAYINQVVAYANAMDFVAISFYPFLKGLHTKADFQNVFDFLHQKINKPIAFAETSQLSEDLTVDAYSLFISGNQCEQNEYLEILSTNAQIHNYEYIIWWAHRDYDELWKILPVEVQDLGKLWISTGIVNEDGAQKKAYSTWKKILNK